MIEELLTEKYRPKEISGLLDNADIKFFLKKSLDEDSIQHMILYGHSSSGKTTAITSMCNEYYGDKYTNCVLELNASDDRGINTIRSTIKNFCEIKSYSNLCKIIILDEVDNMTTDAQYALRRIIEKYVLNVRFIFICNYLHKIIPAIYSRCIILKLSLIEKDILKKHISKLHFDVTHFDTLYDLSNNDIRQIYNFFEIYDKKKVSMDDIHNHFLNVSYKELIWLHTYTKKSSEKKEFQVLYDFFRTKKALNLSNVITIYKHIYLRLKLFTKLKHLYDVQYKFIYMFENVYDLLLVEICYIALI